MKRFGLALVAVVLFFTGCGRPTQDNDLRSSAESAESAESPAPESTPSSGSTPPPFRIEEQVGTTGIKSFDVLMSEPSSNQPFTPAEAAFLEGWKHAVKGVESGPATVKRVSFQSPQFGSYGEPTDAWVVTFTDFCVPVMGPAAPEGVEDTRGEECGASELNAVVDDRTGEYQFSFSYR